MEAFRRALEAALLRQHDYVLASQMLWLPPTHASLRRTPRTPYSDSVCQLMDMLRQSASSSMMGRTAPTSFPSTAPSPMEMIIEEHVRAMEALSQEQPAEALAHYIIILAALQKALPSESNVELPLLRRLALTTYHLAAAAGRPQQEEAARSLSRLFTLCITDRAPLMQSKRWAALGVACLLLRLYWRLGTIRLGGNIVRAVEVSAGPPELRELPRADAVTWCYYRARLAINQGHFQRAEECLVQGVRWCNSQFIPQKRELMVYLVLVRMIHGHLPTAVNLERNGLTTVYGPLATALRQGDLRLFEQALNAQQAYYMRKEIFLVIQLHLRNLILRSFLKKVYLLGLAQGANQENRLSLKLVLDAFRALRLPEGSDMDEVECITANLIFHGFIKGYISHEKATVVLSKKAAFPPPSTVIS